MPVIKSTIVGAMYHPLAHDKLRATKDGHRVILVRDPQNKYDRNAIRCEIDGQMCGHIPATQAKSLAPDIDAGKAVIATLSDYNGLTIEVKDEPDRAAAE